MDKIGALLTGVRNGFMKVPEVLRERLIILALFIICQGAVFLAFWKMMYCLFFSTDRSWLVLQAYDRLANVAINGNGKETISSRANRGTLEGNKGWCLLCRLLDYIEKDHCAKAKDI